MHYDEHRKFFWYRSPEQDLNSNERAFRPYIFDSGYFSKDNAPNKQINRQIYETKFNEIKTPSIRFEDDIFPKNGKYFVSLISDLCNCYFDIQYSIMFSLYHLLIYLDIVKRQSPPRLFTKPVSVTSSYSSYSDGDISYQTLSSHTGSTEPSK